MSTLSSASTLTEVEAAYDDNASYAEDASVAKAKAFVTACRFLIRRLPGSGGTRESHLSLEENLKRDPGGDRRGERLARGRTRALSVGRPAP